MTGNQSRRLHFCSDAGPVGKTARSLGLTSLLCSSNSLAIVTGSEELRSYLAVRKINRCLQCLKTCQIRPDMRTLLPSALFAHRHARERSLKHVSWGRPNALTSFLGK